MTEIVEGSVDEARELAQRNIRFLHTVKISMVPHKKNIVLIVDDEKGIRMKVARDVRTFDPEIGIVEASNGKEAIERLGEIRVKHRRDPVMIITDLNMPIMDGWELIDNLRTEYENAGKASGVPIVVLSSSSGEKSGGFFRKKSVHEGKAGYNPLVSIAKEACVDNRKYDAVGENGLMNWLEHFLALGK